MSLERINVLSQFCINMVLSLAWVAMKNRVLDKGIQAITLPAEVFPENGDMDCGREIRKQGHNMGT